MTTEPNQTGEKRVTGVVKWFDPIKGFGFVISDDGGIDILLHANVLRNFGQSSVVDGARITLNAQHSEKGLQAVEVISIESTMTDAPPALRDLEDLTDDQIAAHPIEPARIKWFDKTKGFGFANIFGSTDDVFVHIEVLRRGGMSDVQAGEAIGLRLIDGKRGSMAVEVVTWESVVR